MQNNKKERGSLSLEACVVVTMFMFLILFIYSFFIVFEAQNELSHVLLSTTNSLSLDTYAAEKTLQSNDATTRLFFNLLYGDSGCLNSEFANYGDWYKSEKGSSGSPEGDFNGKIYASEEARDQADREAQEKSEKNGLVNLETRDYSGRLSSAVNTDLESAISERFTAYLSGGDEEYANKLLDRLHINGGLGGLDFSSSYISSGKLTVILKCEIEYEFNFFGLNRLPVELKACSKLW